MTSNAEETNHRLKGRRSSPTVYLDETVRLRVYKPKKPGDAGEDGAYRTTWKDPLTGRTRSRRLRGTRDQVVRQAKRIGEDVKAKRASDWHTMTWAELGDRYLADPEHHWEPTARRNQEGRLRTLREETLLGTSQLADLCYSSRQFRDALRQLRDTTRARTGRPYAQGSLQCFRDLIGTVVTWAQKEELIPLELAPTKGLEVPRAAPGAKLSVKDRGLRQDDEDGDGRRNGGNAEKVSSAEIPSTDMARALGEVWAERGYGSFWWRALSVDLAGTAAARWGEHHAWRASDFIFEPEPTEHDSDPAPYIQVNRKLLLAKNGSVIGTALPKGPQDRGKKRDALMPEHLIDGLQRRVAEVMAEFGPSGLMFPSPMDPTRPYEPDSFGLTMRNFARQAGWPVDEHGLLLHTWHSLRHLGAVWALRHMGIDPELVSEAMGHSSIVFTMKRYVGTTGESRTRAREQQRARQPRR